MKLWPSLPERSRPAPSATSSTSVVRGRGRHRGGRAHPRDPLERWRRSRSISTARPARRPRRSCRAETCRGRRAATCHATGWAAPRRAAGTHDLPTLTDSHRPPSPSQRVPAMGHVIGRGDRHQRLGRGPKRPHHQARERPHPGAQRAVQVGVFLPKRDRTAAGRSRHRLPGVRRRPASGMLSPVWSSTGCRSCQAPLRPHLPGPASPRVTRPILHSRHRQTRQ